MVNVGERGKVILFLAGVIFLNVIVASKVLFYSFVSSEEDVTWNGDKQGLVAPDSDAKLTLTKSRGFRNSASFRRLKRSAPREEDSTIANYIFSEWGEWNNCSSKQCNVEGVQWRYRSCYTNGLPNLNGNPCGFENLAQSRPCFAEDCESVVFKKYSWSQWSAWGSCSVTCGQGGEQERSRVCGVEGIRMPSKKCSGVNLEQRDCQYSAGCPTLEDWTPWSPCSDTCGSEGLSTRRRECVIYWSFIPSYSDPANKTDSHDDSTANETPDEDVTGVIVYRDGAPTFIVDVRSDLNVESSAFLPENTFKEPVASEKCIAVNKSFEEKKTCRFEGNCPSQWGHWQAWSVCRSDCSPGYRTRGRQCIFNSRNEPCEGRKTLSRRCLPPPCWSQWVNNGECSVTCGAGVQRRTRNCRVFSTLSNRKCIGSSKSVVNCTLKPCENDEWTPWSQFTQCTVSCNRGLQFRNRTCLKESCSEASNDLRVCNPQRCPSWSRWEPYSCCSVSCGKGTRSRTRSCTNGYVGNPGCDGEVIEIHDCYLPPCNKMADVNLGQIPCGTRAHSTLKNFVRLRIFQGRESSPHSWPWQGSWQHRKSIEHPWKHFCGVTLIHSRWVVTAAHCIEDALYGVDHDNPGVFWSVVLGIHKMQDTGRRFFGDKVIVHPKYSRQIATYNDIALIKLRKMVAITDKISPICLPGPLEPRIGEFCTVSGWGQQYRNGPYSNILMEAEIPIIDFKKCGSLGDSYRYFLSKSVHLCAGNPDKISPDSCTGDSGGPLSCKDGNEWYLAGVTSFAFSQCGKLGHSGIYTLVQNFEKWIQETVTLNTYEQC